MSELSLLNFLKNHKILENDIFDMLYFDICGTIYYYGEQFDYPREIIKHHKKNLKSRVKDLKIKYLVKIIHLIKNRKHLKLMSAFFIPHFKRMIPFVSIKSLFIFHSGPKIVSNSYFLINSELEKLEYNVFRPVWFRSFKEEILTSQSIIRKTETIKNILNKGNFNEIVNIKFLKYIENYRKVLTEYYQKQNIQALIVPYDQPFFENLSIKIFKALNKPSFIFLHGLPGRYNMIDDNRSDYLIVWGEAIKNFYIKAGFPEEKIFISGHPYYKNFKYNKLRFSLNNILILTKSMPGNQNTGDKILIDRGNLITYLYKIRNILKNFNIKSVRLRPHPSENILWYYKFVDKNFFQLDKDPLAESLKKSTLVIGPASTIFIESLYYGVNYVIFEPSIDNFKDILGIKLVPPFDGSYDGIPVAKNEKELEYFLKNKIKVVPSVFNKFIKTPFDISFIKKIISSK